MLNVDLLSSSDITRRLNISLRQLYYYELKGIVTPKMITMGTREFKRYTGKDFDKLRRIKSFLDEGYTLNAAVAKADAE